jgi:[acyl-carrier-protein] S-malonyltransferase
VDVEIAVLCPGQGALQPEAGRPWADEPGWALVEQVEAIVDRPVAHLLLDATAEELAFTDAAQLATFTLALVGLDAVRAAWPGLAPIAYAGHSLGQVTALVAAGALPFDAGVALAGARAEATRAADDAKPGCLAALIGCDLEAATAACEATGDCWVAIDNAPGQIVIGGEPDAVERAGAAAKAAGAKGARRLPVGAAFHTPWVAAAADELALAFEAAPWSAPTAPIVTNVDGQAHAGADGWPDRMTAQLVEPVQWTRTQRTLVELGATHAIELPPAGTLKGLAKRAAPELTVAAVATPADLAALADWA